MVTLLRNAELSANIADLVPLAQRNLGITLTSDDLLGRVVFPSTHSGLLSNRQKLINALRQLGSICLVQLTTKAKPLPKCYNPLAKKEKTKTKPSLKTRKKNPKYPKIFVGIFLTLY